VRKANSSFVFVFLFPFLITFVEDSGKSTLGSSLAKSLDLVFVEADDFHSAENKAKMGEGKPLTDEDRMPWLEALNQEMLRHSKRGGCVLACSALKKKYREVIFRGVDRKSTSIIFCHGQQECLEARLNARVGHFAKSSLLKSQLEILEEPDANEAFLVVRIRCEDSPEEQLQAAKRELIR
jgi:gluconokinase